MNLNFARATGPSITQVLADPTAAMLHGMFVERFRVWLSEREDVIAHAVRELGVYGAVKRAAGIYYQGQIDKGDNSHDSSLHSHTDATERLFQRFLEHDVKASANAVWYGRALAIGHELFDLRQPQDRSQPLFSIETALGYNFGMAFTEDLYALGKQPEQSYLGDYVPSLSRYPFAAAFKLMADLKLNMSANRVPVPAVQQSQKFRDKKAVGGGYEMESSYLLAVLSGRIEAGASLPEYIVRDHAVSGRIRKALRKDFGLLERNVGQDVRHLMPELHPRRQKVLAV